MSYYITGKDKRFNKSPILYLNIKTGELHHKKILATKFSTEQEAAWKRDLTAVDNPSYEWKVKKS